MKIRGIRLAAKNEYSKYIYSLLGGINIKGYRWYVSQTEILYYDEIKQRAESYNFSGKLMSGEEFLQLISTSDQLVYLANIQAYPLDCPIQKIISYQDFLDSNCRMILLCADCECYDIYCKDDKDIQLIYANALNLHFNGVEYITDENDERTGLCL